MPEFVLDMGDTAAAKRFNALPEFVQGYIEAMFFTSTGSGGDEDLQYATFAELRRDALAQIRIECAVWQAENQTALNLAYASGEYDAAQAGRDYWFTRNGHGAGFWDRPQLTKIVCGKNNETNLGDVLADRSQHSERYLYRDSRGLIGYE